MDGAARNGFDQPRRISDSRPLTAPSRLSGVPGPRASSASACSARCMSPGLAYGIRPSVSHSTPRTVPSRSTARRLKSTPDAISGCFPTICPSAFAASALTPNDAASITEITASANCGSSSRPRARTADRCSEGRVLFRPARSGAACSRVNGRPSSAASMARRSSAASAGAGCAGGSATSIACTHSGTSARAPASATDAVRSGCMDVSGSRATHRVAPTGSRARSPLAVSRSPFAVGRRRFAAHRPFPNTRASARSNRAGRRGWRRRSSRTDRSPVRGAA